MSAFMPHWPAVVGILVGMGVWSLLAALWRRWRIHRGLPKLRTELGKQLLAGVELTSLTHVESGYRVLLTRRGPGGVAAAVWEMGIQSEEALRAFVRGATVGAALHKHSEEVR